MGVLGGALVLGAYFIADSLFTRNLARFTPEWATALITGTGGAVMIVYRADLLSIRHLTTAVLISFSSAVPSAIGACLVASLTEWRFDRALLWPTGTFCYTMLVTGSLWFRLRQTRT